MWKKEATAFVEKRHYITNAYKLLQITASTALNTLDAEWWQTLYSWEYSAISVFISFASVKQYMLRLFACFVVTTFPLINTWFLSTVANQNNQICVQNIVCWFISVVTWVQNPANLSMKIAACLLIAPNWRGSIWQ